MIIMTIRGSASTQNDDCVHRVKTHAEIEENKNKQSIYHIRTVN